MSNIEQEQKIIDAMVDAAVVKKKEDELTKIFKKQVALRYHPNKGGNAKVFIKLKKVYDHLKKGFHPENMNMNMNEDPVEEPANEPRPVSASPRNEPQPPSASPPKARRPSYHMNAEKAGPFKNFAGSYRNAATRKQSASKRSPPPANNDPREYFQNSPPRRQTYRQGRPKAYERTTPNRTYKKPPSVKPPPPRGTYKHGMRNTYHKKPNTPQKKPGFFERAASFFRFGRGATR